MKGIGITCAGMLVWMSVAGGNEVEGVCMEETEICVKGEDYSSKTPYPAPSDADITNRIPSGCNLIGWTYLGRHASRYATSPKTCDQTQQILKDSDIDWTCPSEADAIKYGHITSLGAREAHGIGQRFKEFKKGAIKKVTTTAKLRTQQTAQSFLSGMGEDPNQHPLSYVPLDEDTKLRFFDNCLKYVRGHKTQMPAEVDKSKATILQPITDRVSSHLNKKVTPKETETLFNECFYKWIGEEVSKRRPVDQKLCELFTDADIDMLSYRKDLKEYYKKGPGSGVFNGTKISCGLIDDIIDDIKQLTDGDATLRFAHAETLVPVYSLLNIGMDAPALMSDWSLSQIADRQWRLSTVCPMASNAAFLKLSCPSISPEPQLLFLLNERQRDWDLPTCKGKLCTVDKLADAFPPTSCNWGQMCDI